MGLFMKRTLLFALSLITMSYGLYAGELEHLSVKPGSTFSIELPTSNKTSSPWVIYKSLDNAFLSFEKVEKIEKGTWLQKLACASQCFEKWTFQSKQNLGESTIEMFQYQDGIRKNEYQMNTGALCNLHQLPKKFVIHIQ